MEELFVRYLKKFDKYVNEMEIFKWSKKMVVFMVVKCMGNFFVLLVLGFRIKKWKSKYIKFDVVVFIL